MTALNSDPDTVMDFMKQMATNLYNAIDKQMTRTTLRSKYSIYNDKEMTTQYKNYTTIITRSSLLWRVHFPSLTARQVL